VLPPGNDLDGGTSSRCSTWLISDRADGTDAIDRLIATRLYADDPISGWTLTTKRNLDTDRPEKRLRATQSTREGTRIFGPAGAVTALIRPLNADSQKIGGTANPKSTFAH